MKATPALLLVCLVAQAAFFARGDSLEEKGDYLDRDSRFFGNGCRCCPDRKVANGTLRLFNPDKSVTNEGRLEVFVDCQWATVCDDGFNTAAARVACRQLGLPTDVVTVFEDEEFARGYGLPIGLDEISCTGDEERLLDCGSSLLFQSDCGKAEDVGVGCASKIQ